MISNASINKCLTFLYAAGKQDNPVDLPAGPYEAAFAIQDRYFKDNGELFYPAFPGDPAYDDFIDADVTLPEDKFPCGGVSIIILSSSVSLHNRFNHLNVSAPSTANSVS